MFSKCVGMEPATDLKKRICSLCEEAGFVVVAAKVSLHRRESLQESARLVLVYIREQSWSPIVPDVLAGSAWEKHKDYQMEVRAIIRCDGAFSGTVNLSCCATDHVGDVFSPTLRDCHIPISDLAGCLPEIAKQMHGVIASRKRGESGPWRFAEGKMRWESWG